MPGGRPKGSTNAKNMALKTMILNSLERVGGEEYLMRQAEENPSAFLTILGKIIPSELNAKLSGAVKVNGTINFVRPRD